MKYPRHNWTKAEVNKIVDLWDTHTVPQIAAKLDVREGQVAHIAWRLRKAGLPLARRTGVGGYMNNLIDEVVKERKVDGNVNVTYS